MKIKFLTFLFFVNTILYGQVKVESLSTEHLTNPIGLGNFEPRFSWILSSNDRNVIQTAYEVRVGQNEKELIEGKRLSWHSGKVNEEQSVYISYKGNQLKSGKRYYWQVRVWDNKERKSKWSEPAYFQMSFKDPLSEFKAFWISPGYKEDTVNRPSPYFRKTFNIPANKKIKSATAYITSHGIYEAYINGRRVGDAYLTPGWTSYNKRLQYQVYDVTESLNQSNNAVGVILGSGWYRGYIGFSGQKNQYGKDIALLFQMDIEYEDGTKDNIISDQSWKSSIGPIVSSEIYDGEIYDTRKEMTDWSIADFSDEDWYGVIESDFQKDNLIATENEPIRKQEIIKAKKIIYTPSGELVIDFGQNLVGWVQMEVQGNPGDSIILYHAEVLDKEGNFYTENLRSAKQRNIYILKNKEKTLFEPHFTFQGFRYLKVEGYPTTINLDKFKAIALYSDMPKSGNFTTSDSLINQLQHNIQWGQKGNFLDIPTDCPQRDERLGWTGDAQVFFRTAAYNMDVRNFFSKWLKDLAADQRTDGAVPHVIPNVLSKSSVGSAGWADAATIIPWQAYLLYGDKRLLESQYKSMKDWVQYMNSKSENYLWNSDFHFGDWLFYSPEDDRDGKAAITDKYLIAQSFFANSIQLLINAAEVLDKTEDVRHYTILLNNVKEAYQNEYLTSSGRLVSGTQTAYVLALHFDMLPEELRQQAADRLVENVKSYGYHLTTGFLGTPYICHVLSRFGHTDVAYRLLNQKSYPSWLYPVTMGATTIWERWDGIKPDSTFQTPRMNSYNHYAYGAIGDWMYRNIAGINLIEDGPGYKLIKIKPFLGGGLTKGAGSLETIYGTIKTEWIINDNQFKLEVEIPSNTTANIFIPAFNEEAVTEGRKDIASAKEIQLIDIQDGYLQVKTGSGSYQFISQLNE